jgi:hypothetical protein
MPTVPAPYWSRSVDSANDGVSRAVQVVAVARALVVYL